MSPMMKPAWPVLLFAAFAASAAPVIEGSILKPDGSSAGRAVVSATDVTATVTAAPLHPRLTQADGRGRFRLRVPAGTYGVTATLPGTAGTFVSDVVVDTAGRGHRLTLTLAAGGVPVGGVVRTRSGLMVPGAIVMAGAYGPGRGDVFQTIADKRGQWRLWLPSGTYGFRAHKGGTFSACVTLEATTPVNLSLHLDHLSPPSGREIQGTAQWIRNHILAVNPHEPGLASANKEALQALVGDARVVGVGEATHGTHEFHQFQTSFFQFLAAEMGFSVFALEVNWYEALAVNRYVLDGVGDPVGALRGLRSWPAATDERLDLIRWMRRYNQDPAHTRKLKFYGFDMQYPTSSAGMLTSFLTIVDEQYLATVRKSLQLLDSGTKMGKYGKLPQATHEQTAADLSGMVNRIDGFKSEYVARSSSDEWLLARQHATILAQAERLLRSTSKPLNPDSTFFGIRDRAMAENIMSMLAAEPPDTKAVVVGHNGHLGAERYLHGEVESMGMHLRRILQSHLLVVGCIFGQGSFLSFDRAQRRVGEFKAGPPRPNMLEHLLRTARIPTGLVDLRAASRQGPVRRGLRGRFFTWSGESVGPTRIEDMLAQITPSDAYDAVLYVDRTTPSRRLSSRSE